VRIPSSRSEGPVYNVLPQLKVGLYICFTKMTVNAGIKEYLCFWCKDETCAWKSPMEHKPIVMHEHRIPLHVEIARSPQYIF
jgi:hypothetical protein